MALFTHSFGSQLTVTSKSGVSNSTLYPTHVSLASDIDLILHIIHKWSATILKPLNNDYIVTMAPIKGWDILCSKWTVSSWISCVGTMTESITKMASPFPSMQWLYLPKLVQGRTTGEPASRLWSPRSHRRATVVQIAKKFAGAA